MIKEAINTIVEKKSWEVVKLCETVTSDVDVEINELMKTIKKSAPIEVFERILEIEDLYTQRQTEVVKLAYNKGFDNGLHLYKELKNML
ncbi:hypothetical protein J25TS5_03850 [Paenibacillus faecis]|uniref:hypothetical protein n=1 Tax=Paenibacillus faecis TaxID=862114 RepID=UPI001B0E06E7|nr:hypothetical protein [Paenibacillus faecis]GIO83453.1 hypothetical protein J25TS5_03850 [Paenibacillus faecis]